MHVSHAQMHADVVIVNADVRTMSRERPRAEAVAIKGNKFVAVGTNKEILAFAGPKTKKIDAGGKLVLPGFNDAHVHFAAIGNKFSTIDLKTAKTPGEIAQRLAYYVRFLPKGRWILGGGWDLTGSVPNRKIVDPVTADNPVFVYSSDGKAAFANGAALSKARITKLTRDPPNGVIVRDDESEPTGILKGSAFRLVSSIVPTDHTRNWPEIIETASNYAASLGVTSVQDMHSDELADVYRQLEREGKLKTRVYDCSPISAWKRLAASGIKAASGDAMVRTGCVKYFSDGNEDGAEILQLQRDIAAADKAGLQVMIHAIGSRANGIVLDAFEKTIAVNGTRDRRFRIEHAQNAADEDLPRFVRSGIIASMQPWLFNGTSSSIYATHLKLRTPLAFGSDASITDFDPLLGIRSATTGPGAMTADEAVRAYTLGSAYAEFQENAKGSIAVGKYADLVILSSSIFDGAAMADKATVLTTFVDGKQVYDSK